MPRDVTQYRDRLFQYAYRKTRRWHVADDIVQEAFSRWYQGERSNIHTPYAWLLTVVKRLCIEYWRHAAREVSFEALPTSIEDAPADEMLERWCEVVEAISLAVHSLTADQRAALILREVFGTPYAEIASALGKSGAACRQLVHRARSMLQQCRSQHMPEDARVATQFLRAVEQEDAAGAIRMLSEAQSAA